MSTVKPIERTQKQKDHSRAFGIRSLLARGKPVANDERAWFDTYVTEHPKMALGSTPPAETPLGASGEVVEGDKVPSPEGSVDAKAEATGTPEVADVKPPPKASAPPPPRAAIPKAPKVSAPPRFDHATEGEAKRARNANPGGKWQDKYRPKNDEGSHVEPREYLCCQVASVWGGFLATAGQLLTAIGKAPAVNPEEIMPSIVLACDELLPDQLDFSPEKMAIAVTGILAAQCAINYKAIGAELKRRREAAAHEGELGKMKRRTAEAEARFQAEESAKRAAKAAADAARAAQEESAKAKQQAEPPIEHEDLIETKALTVALPEFDPDKDAI